MKVRCIYSSYKNIIPSLDPSVYEPESVLHIDSGKEYIVYGYATLKKDGKIKFLIIDKTDLPSFYISDLFEITDSCLSIGNWHFGQGNAEYLLTNIFGYEEFVKSREHFEGVILHDEEPLEQFWKWKEIVDRQYFNPEDEWETIKADVDGVDILFQRNRRTGEYKNFKFV